MRSRQRPVITELRGRLIRLRPFVAEDVAAAWRGLALQDETAHPRQGSEDRGPDPSAKFRRRLARSGRLWRGGLDLAIDRRGRLVGQVQARTSPQQTLPPGVFEIGVLLYRERDRGKGYGKEAVKLLTEWLFESGGAERVQATTDARNAPMRAVLEDLGFSPEGIMRAFGAFSDGSRVDGALYAVVKSDRSSPRRRGNAAPASGRRGGAKLRLPSEPSAHNGQLRPDTE
jgi:RimJ/RimL family protein N-acetyltransferase